MKKILALISAAAILLSFAACGSKECDVCGESGADKYTMAGESAYLCDNCGSLAELAGAKKD